MTLLGPPRLTLRRAWLRDVQAISALVDRAYAHYLPRMGKKPAPMCADYDGLVRAGEVDVLLVDDEVVGAIVMRAESDHVFVDNVAVEPREQGRGYGRRLMALAEERARTARLPIIRLYTHEKMTENIAFYRSQGFRDVERRREDGYERIYFVKHVDQPSLGPSSTRG